MKKSPLILLLFFCLFSNAFTQPKQFIDSLKQDLLIVTNDSLRFRLFDELAWTYKRIDADSSLMYGKLGLEVSEQLDPSLKSIILATIATNKTENRIDDLGIAELEQAIAINSELGNEGRTASNYHNIANAYEIKGQLETAAEFYLKSANIQKKLGDTRRHANSLSGLGLVYQKLRDFDKAIELFNEGLSYFEPGNRSRNRFYNNLGIAYIGKGDYLRAKEQFLVLLRDESTNENETRFASVAGNLGECYYRLKQYDSALFYSRQSLEIKQRRNQKGTIAFPAFTLAKTLRDQGFFDDAIEYATIALKDSESTGDLQNTQDAYIILEETYYQKGNYKKAYDLLTTAYELQDSLAGTKAVEAINNAQVKYDTEYKVWENELLRKDASIQSQTIKTQRATIIGAIVGVILLLLIALLLRKRLHERKRLMAKIESQSLKLQELDQAKTRFFANISHDLRSPLTLILGALDTINTRDHEILDTESKELLDVGYKNGKRLLYLADEIMDLTRLEEGKVTLEMQLVKVVPYLRLLTKMFSSAADIKLIELKFDTAEDEDLVLGLDPHHFEKIIYNLLSNAIKFTPEKGVVIVQLKSDTETIFINVSDSGTGIPPDSIKHIFDRYYQSPTDAFRSQTGVGIGLALVKELVELHGGTIEVTSDEKGTRFFIALPYQKNTSAAKAIIPERSLDVISKNSLWVDLQEEQEKLQVPSLTNLNENAKSILIVEDHKELRSYLKSLLAPEYKIHLAANGSAALDILQAGNIDLILTDLMMPYMDGFELIEHLKKDKELKKIPVLVVSARTDKSEKLELLDKGAKDVISKPFDKAELQVRIKNALSEEWNATKKLTSLYGETAQEFEKSIMARLERLIIKRVDDQHLSVLDLADEMAASERKVYRLIKKISGLTPFELIKEIRWQYLDDYLKNNNVKNATEAAQLIGMNNVSSFSDQYQKRFGNSIKDVIE